MTPNCCRETAAKVWEDAANLARGLCGHGRTAVAGGYCEAYHKTADAMEAKSRALRSEPQRREVKEEIRKLKEDLAASRASHVMSGAAVQKLEEKLAERREAEQRVIEAAKQKYRSIIYTSGVSQEFADKELVEAVAALLGDSKPLSECNRAVDPGNHEDCTACLAAPPSVEVPPVQEDSNRRCAMCQSAWCWSLKKCLCACHYTPAAPEAPEDSRGNL